MADEKTEAYVSPNNATNEKGEVVPAEPKVVADRINALLAASSAAPEGEPSGYEVRSEWTTSAAQLHSPHKKGEKLKASEVSVPSGIDRKAHLAELVAVGLLRPVYDGVKGQEQAAVQASAQEQARTVEIPHYVPGNVAAAEAE